MVYGLSGQVGFAPSFGAEADAWLRACEEVDRKKSKRLDVFEPTPVYSDLLEDSNPTTLDLPDPVEEERVPEPEPTFWRRLKGLFRRSR